MSAEEFWRGKCPDCAHPDHEMTCHEPVYNGDPSNGPAYCPCAVQIENMELEIIRLRDRRTPRRDEGMSTNLVTVTFHLDHDFNAGRTEAGFHEVLIPAHMEEMIRSGMVVTFGGDGLQATGRIRCLIAVIEEVEPPAEAVR